MLDFLLLLTFVVPFPFWILMIFLPNAEITRKATNNFWVFILLGALYVFVLVGGTIAAIGQAAFSLSAFTTTAGLAKLFALPATALLAWLHMTATDLASGFLIYRVSRQLGWSNLMTSVALVFTLLTGPLGLFIFAMRHLLYNMQHGATSTTSVTTTTPAQNQPAL